MHRRRLLNFVCQVINPLHAVNDAIVEHLQSRVVVHQTAQMPVRVERSNSTVIARHPGFHPFH